MVRREKLVNLLEAFGYTRRAVDPKMHCFRKVGAAHALFVPCKDELTDTYAREVLLRSGLSGDEIERFIAAHS